MTQKEINEQSLLAGFVFGLQIAANLKMSHQFPDWNALFQEIPNTLKQIANGDLTLIDSDAELQRDAVNTSLGLFKKAPDGASAHRSEISVRHRKIAGMLASLLPPSLGRRAT